jgi:hypothetical protein
MRIVPLLILVMLCFQATAQMKSKVTLMNGRELPCTIKADTGFVLVVAYQKRNGKVKEMMLNKGEVFSYTSGEGSGPSAEKIIYTQDSLLGNDLTVEEMRIYLAGERDAANLYKARHVFWIGFIACGAIAYIGEDGVISTLVPPVLHALVYLPLRVRARPHQVSQDGYRYNDFYADGYLPVAKSRRELQALKGGFLGAAVGLATYLVLSK